MQMAFNFQNISKRSDIQVQMNSI